MTRDEAVAMVNSDDPNWPRMFDQGMRREVGPNAALYFRHRGYRRTGVYYAGNRWVGECELVGSGELCDSDTPAESAKLLEDIIDARCSKLREMMEAS